MRERARFVSSRFPAQLLIGLLLLAPVRAQEQTIRTTHTLTLGETAVRVNVYEKRSAAAVTFVAPHHDERIGRELAREFVGERGGRFVEIEAADENGRPARRLRFRLGENSYSIDPNRIFTENGRRCGGYAPEVSRAVERFSADLLEIIFGKGGDRSRGGEPFVVAVHNNGDQDERSPQERINDLTASAYLRPGALRPSPRTAFHAQASGVFLSNAEQDEDNFILLSTPRFLGFFAGQGFNVVVQKPAEALRERDCATDDGSLSVYAAQHDIQYINLEADAAHGASRQRQMFAAVYRLAAQLYAERQPNREAARDGDDPRN